MHIPAMNQKVADLESYAHKFSGDRVQDITRDMERVISLAARAGEIQHRLSQYSYSESGETNPLYLILSARLLDHNIWLRDLQYAITSGEKFTGQTDPARCKFGGFLSQYTVNNPEMEQYLPAIREAHKKLHNSAIAVNELEGSVQEKFALYEQQAVPAYEKIDDVFQKVITASRKKYTEAEDDKQALLATFDTKAHTVESELKSMEMSVANKIDGLLSENSVLVGVVNRYLLIAGGIAVVLCLLLGWIVSKSITTPIQITIKKFIESSESTGEGSKQISNASIELTEGVSEQASAIEETSASLEQINAMAQQNTSNAQKATAVSKETNDATNAGLTTMSEMQFSIEKVRESAEESSRIISTIEEIALASNEQSEGLSQLSAAIVQIDQVTQQNAANAEETSSSAEHLQGQSHRLLEIMNTLTRIVYSSGQRNQHGDKGHYASNGKKGNPGNTTQNSSDAFSVKESDGGADIENYELNVEHNADLHGF